MIGRFLDPRDLIPGLVYSPGGTGGSLPSVTITNDLGLFIVTDSAYGALGNGVANDTTAIQLAIDAAENAGGGIVYFPPGTYLVTSISIAGNDVELQGPGILKMHVLGVGSLESSALVSITGNRNGIRRMRLDGNKAALPAGYNRLININGTGGNGYDNYVTGCQLYNLRAWVDPNNPDQTSANQVATADALQIVNGRRTRIEYNRITDVGHNGIRVGGDSNRIVGNYIYNWTHGRGIRCYSGTDLEIVGNTVIGDLASAEQGSNILCDPGSGDEGRLDRVLIERNYCVRTNGTGAQALKIASCGLVIVRGGHYEVDDTDHQAIRIEDGVGRVIFEEDCVIKPNVFWSPADNAGGSVYQGQILSQANDGGFAQFTLDGSSTALIVGKSLFVRNSGVPAYNREHQITEVAGLVVTTNVPYDAGAIDAGNSCHSGIDEVIMRDCTVGSDAFDHGPWLENLCSPRFSAERVKFGGLYARTGNFSGIDWQYIHDRNLEQFRFVDNELTCKATGAFRGIRNSQTYPLLRDVSGKVICKGNRIKNVDPTYVTAPVLVYATDTITKAGGTMTSDTNGGFARFTTTVPHGLRVGDSVTVSGHSVAGYNTTHTVTARTSLTFTTNVAWTANGTGGSFTGSITFPNRATLFNSDGDRAGAYLVTAIPSGVDTVFQRGDVFRKTDPSAAGTPGYVCTTAGTLDASVGTMGTLPALT